jgi:glutamate racemase
MRLPAPEFSRTAAVPVLGIVDAGVDLFFEALSADPLSSIFMFGTRTTIESGVHRDALMRKGIDAKRIAAVSCHGLAAAIETDPGGSVVAELIARCVSEACQADLAAGPLYAGLCCTHYSYVQGRFRSVLERQSGKKVDILDPGDRMVRCLAPETDQKTAGAARSAIEVEVISQVSLDENKRRAVARLLAPVSEITAQALLSYIWRPGLF